MTFLSSQQFVESIRRAEPVAATVDALSRSANSSSLSDSTIQNNNGSVSFRSVDQINITSRYVSLGIEKGTHAFDAILPRLLSSGTYSSSIPKVMADRYKAGMIYVEHFIKHWLGEGSALHVQKSSQDIPDVESHKVQQEQSRGARVKVPRGGPRL